MNMFKIKKKIQNNAIVQMIKGEREMWIPNSSLCWIDVHSAVIVFPGYLQHLLHSGHLIYFCRLTSKGKILVQIGITAEC